MYCNCSQRKKKLMKILYEYAPIYLIHAEHDAREGYSNLQNYPITWYRKKLLSDLANDAKHLAPNASGLIDGIGQLFRSGSNTSNSSSKRQQQNKHDGTSIPMAHVGVLATITVVDTDDHGPVIQIRALDNDNPSNQAAQKAIREYMTNGKPWWEDPCIKDQPPSKVIPLYMVDKVASSGWSFSSDPTSGGVKLYAAPESKGFLSSAGPELLRFDTLGGGGSTLSDALWSSNKPNEPNKYADKVIVQLKSLIDWNRRRMAKEIKKGRVSVAPKSTGNGYVSMT